MENKTRNYSMRRLKANIIFVFVMVDLLTSGYLLNRTDSILEEINALKEYQTAAAEYEKIEADVEIKSAEIEPSISTASFKNEDETQQYISMSLPDYDTSFKAYMDYRCITDKTSKQYELQQKADTDDLGLRKYGDYYLIGLGTYYADSVGEKFRITLENDKVFYAMTGDIKADIHTDKNNMYSPVYNSNGTLISANVVEFIVDTKAMDRKAKLSGSVGTYEDFSGNIVKIEKIID